MAADALDSAALVALEPAADEDSASELLAVVVAELADSEAAVEEGAAVAEPVIGVL